MTGQAAVPVFALAAFWLPGSWLAAAAGYGGLAVLSFRSGRGGGRVPRVRWPSPPPAVWWISLAYLVISIALPFGSFSDESLVREMYSDGFQRFGTIYALAAGVPPANPFVAGEPLRYYWLSFLPTAWEWSLWRWSLFDVWKVTSGWSAFLLIPVLWSASTALLRRRAAGWGAVLFGFVFASWEIFAGDGPRRALAGLMATGAWTERLSAALAGLLATDPDHVVGVVNRYSDQLLMEDFLYIPQDAWAIAVVLVGLLFYRWRRPRAAALCLSGLAGGNPFVGLPALAALSLLHLLRHGAIRGFALAAVAAMGSGLWFSVSGIVAGPVTVWAAGLAGALAVAGWAEHRPSAVDRPDAGRSIGVARAAAAAALILLALLALTAPAPAWSVAGVLALNYGPAFPAALAALAAVALGASWTHRWRSSSALLFVVLFGVALHALVVVLLLQFRDAAPEAVRAASYQLGLEVNLFNLYHKASKVLRLGWAALAGLAVGAVWPTLRPWPLSRWILATSLVLPALVTTVARPLTYVRSAPVAEAAAGRYLREHGAGLDTRVLVEDFRRSAINQLAPVSVFYISAWAGGEPGLTHAVGTWADQYLPPDRRWVTAERERLSRSLFRPRLQLQRLADLVEQEGIDYVLTRERYDLGPVAELVVDRPSGYLHEVAATSPRKRLEKGGNK